MEEPQTLLDRLINDTADVWNKHVASDLQLSVDELRELILSRGIYLSEDKVKVELKKQVIQTMGDCQKSLDLYELNQAKTTGAELDQTRATAMDRYTMTVKDGSELVDAIALTGKILIGVDFSDSTLAQSYFCHCTFYNCSFMSVSMENCVFSGCTFVRCDFNGCDLTGSSVSRTKFIECNMDDSTVDYAVISDCAFLVTTFNNTSFIQSRILYTGISDCGGTGSDWKDVDVIQCSMSNTDLTASDFRRTSFVDNIFIRVSFIDCDFNNASFTCVTTAMCEIDAQYLEFFSMNHALYSPAVYEWESEVDDEDDMDDEGDVDIDQADDDSDLGDDDEEWK